MRPFPPKAQKADDLHCDLLYSSEDFFLMAGGTLLPGRVDNHVSVSYTHLTSIVILLTVWVVDISIPHDARIQGSTCHAVRRITMDVIKVEKRDEQRCV